MSERTQMMGKDLPVRLATGAVGIPIILLIIYLGTPLFNLAVMLAAGIAGAELARMIERQNQRLLGFTLLGIILLILAMTLHWLVLLPIAALLGLLLLAPGSGGPRIYLYGLLAVLYIGLACGLMILIRNHSQGLAWILLLFITVWTTDSFALLGGRRFGVHKLAPNISPSKTVEGALIGFGAGFLAGMSAASLLDLPFPAALVASLLLPAATEAGDLLESWIKRHLRVKDSGSILPGHGGFLDRMDGLLLAAPCLFLLILALV